MESVKLQKYFSDCGVMSRRAAEEEIKMGRVKVNGSVAELGLRIDPERDVVEHRGRRIKPSDKERICILLNKPRGFVTTLSDEKGRRTVADLVASVGRRVYPIGRLDMDSDGLLLLTDDGELANRLTHPRHEIPKIYHVTVSGEVSAEQLSKLCAPMELAGYEILPVKSEVISRDGRSTTLEMTLYEGRNRQIRKMCEAVGLRISRLCRVAIGELELGALEVGRWRELTPDELSYLKGEIKTLRKDTKNA
jgi:23S rRNA pseudouridine2605 synthase